MITRRSILFGLLAAPIVVRAGLCMPVRPMVYDMAAFRADFEAGLDRLRERLINPPLILHRSQAAHFERYGALPLNWRLIEPLTYVRESSNIPLDAPA